MFVSVERYASAVVAWPCIQPSERTQERMGLEVHFENKGMDVCELSCELEPHSGMVVSQPTTTKHTMCDPDGGA